MPAAAAIDALIEQHFENATAFLPALQWAISEVLDNVLPHAEATEPGAVYAEFTPKQHRLDVAICDLDSTIWQSPVHGADDGRARCRMLRPRPPVPTAQAVM